MPDPSLLWISSHLRHPSGHAEEARAFLHALEAEGHAPAALELSSQTDTKGLTTELPASVLEMIARCVERETPDPIVAVHAYTPRPDRDFSHPGATNVARIMFETDRLPEGWAELLGERDEVWVPSRHNHEVFAEGGVSEDRLRILGETLDFDFFAPGAEPLELSVPPGAFVFLSNFDFSERKGWRQLILAWARAFEPNDPVCLVLKTLSVATWDEDYIRERILHFLDTQFGAGARDRLAPIEIIAERYPSERIPRLYAAADAYVSPSRGEGWGRTFMEAMAMGLPTIASRWSGTLEFMRDEDSWLIDGELVPVSDRDQTLNELYRGHHWFEADIDEVATALSEIAGDPAAARAKAAPARERLITEFGPGPISARILELATAVAERRQDSIPA